MLGCEEVVAAFAVLHGGDAGLVCVAEEAMEDTRLIEASDDQASDIRNK